MHFEEILKGCQGKKEVLYPLWKKFSKWTFTIMQKKYNQSS